jgi:hypothetical protein
MSLAEKMRFTTTSDAGKRNIVRAAGEQRLPVDRRVWADGLWLSGADAGASRKESKGAQAQFRPTPHQQAGFWSVCPETGPPVEALWKVTVITAPSASLCASMLPPISDTKP